MLVGVISFHTSLCSQVSDHLLAPVVCQMLGVLSSENTVEATALSVDALVGVDVEEGGGACREGTPWPGDYSAAESLPSVHETLCSIPAN